MEIKQNSTACFLAILLIMTGIPGGGYFCFVSAAAGIVLMAVITCRLIWSRSFYIVFGWNLAAAVILPLGYFVVGFWAVDTGMFLLGVVKFLPVFLYFIALCQIGPEEKERLICLLPVFGSLMTLISFIMMQFPALQPYAAVGERLAGFFQYPNTYALFMLVCMLISIYQVGGAISGKECTYERETAYTGLLRNGKRGWEHFIHILIALLGIGLSGSRIVIVLAVFSFLILAVSQKGFRKYGILCVAVFAFLSFVLVLCGLGEEVIKRLSSIENASISFKGRLLYGQDAVKIIADHPFGLGYYGFYFLQKEVQSGVYSVVNVHNEFVQMMLDIGILPALVLYGALIRSLISKGISARERLVLLVITIHSLFDFDFQYLVMCFVLFLFLEQKNIRKIEVHELGKGAAALLFILTCVLCIPTGISDFFYIYNEPQKAVKFYDGNTLAAVELMAQTNDAVKMEQLADKILENNTHVSAAYRVKAYSEFSRGNIEKFVEYELTAIGLEPYWYEEYVNYLDRLVLCAESCLQKSETEKAIFCLERAEEIPGMLEEVKERTSRLGWETKYRPKVTLPGDELTVFKELRHRIEKQMRPGFSNTACKSAGEGGCI